MMDAPMEAAMEDAPLMMEDMAAAGSDKMSDKMSSKKDDSLVESET